MRDEDEGAATTWRRDAGVLLLPLLVVGLLEAFSTQIDNLLLPIFYFVLHSLVTAALR